MRNLQIMLLRGWLQSHLSRSSTIFTKNDKSTTLTFGYYELKIAQFTVLVGF